MTKTGNWMVLSIIMTTVVFSAVSQSLPMAAGAGGTQVSIGIGMVNADYEGLFIETGTVVESYLYLGLGWNLKHGQLAGDSMQESYVRGVCGIPVLRQDELIPFSFFLTGSYEKLFTTSDYLDANERIRTGTGYMLAVDAYRDVQLMDGLVLRPGFSGMYASGVTITESILGAASPVPALQDRYVVYLYGIRLGLLFELDERLVFGTSLHGHLDNEYAVHYGLAFSISSKKQ